MQQVILVNEKDENIGVMEKLLAHQKGLLHRAVSVFIFNDKKELLIQQRVKGKYHSELLWANTCCSHPFPGEETIDAAKRRLQEEMGIDCSLSFKKKFIYQITFDNELTEHEMDYIFEGNYNFPPTPDKKEVANWKWISMHDLKSELKSHPEIFAFWFTGIIRLYY
jgi:isopentenyl-diphosphate delta-isomerase